MKIFVAGGTGVVGVPATRALVAAGHDVSVVSRSTDKDAAIDGVGARPVRVSLFDAPGLAAATVGHEAIVNLATNIPPMSKAARPSAWDVNNRIRVEGAANLVDAAIANGGVRYIQESITFPYVDGGDAWIDESFARDDSLATAGATAAEASTQRFTDTGGTGVVLRFAQFYGAASSHTKTFVSMAAKGLSPFLGPPDAYTSFVHADDAAEAVLAALDAPAGVYNVAEDDPMRRRDLAAQLASLVGRTKARSLPHGLLTRLNASVEPLTRSQRVSNRAFAEATGWRPRIGPLDGWTSVVEAIR